MQYFGENRWEKDPLKRKMLFFFKLEHFVATSKLDRT